MAERIYDRFDAIVLLSAPTAVILDRIEQGTTNECGKRKLSANRG